MAINTVISSANSAYPNGEALPVLEPIPTNSESIANSGTSAASTNSIPASARAGAFIWRVCGDTAVWVAFGASPVAAAGSGYYLPAGGVLEISGYPGHKVAVINA